MAVTGAIQIAIIITTLPCSKIMYNSHLDLSIAAHVCIGRIDASGAADLCLRVECVGPTAVLLRRHDGLTTAVLTGTYRARGNEDDSDRCYHNNGCKHTRH